MRCLKPRNKESSSSSLQLRRIAKAILRLSRRRGRIFPGNIDEVEELAHIGLRRVALGQAGQAEATLDQFQNSRVIAGSMRNIVRFCKRRNDNQRNAESSV